VIISARSQISCTGIRVVKIAVMRLLQLMLRIPEIIVNIHARLLNSCIGILRV